MMVGVDTPATLGSLLGLLMAGLLTAWLARLSIGSPYQGACQGLFFVAFAAVGISIAITHTWGPGWCCGSGSVLAVMSLAAVVDVRGQWRPSDRDEHATR